MDIRQDQADRFDNRIDVMTKTFLGLTVACARCHDHKFDAISTKDYYALFGFLESSNYRLVRFDTHDAEPQGRGRAGGSCATTAGRSCKKASAVAASRPLRQARRLSAGGRELEDRMRTQTRPASC